MVEQKSKNDCSNNLEDTVRTLQEENAKLLQLLRSQGCVIDPPENKSAESSHITFHNSDITSTTNTINTSNQISHQHVNNHGATNQQNYGGQVVHGHQANVTPNFNTVIQTTQQPFVQNNSNTLVQNNTNLIQPINLMNFNNVSFDSLHSFFNSPNNPLFLSSSSTSTTTTTSTLSSSTPSNLLDSSEHQVSIRPKPSLTHVQSVDQSKVKSESYENISRQLSTSSNSETTNLLDNDLNHKQPRPIRPKPSSRANSLQMYSSLSLTESKPLISNVLTPSSLINNTNPTSSTVSILSPSTSFDETHLDLSPQLLASKPLEAKKPAKARPRNRKSTTSTAPPSIPSTTASAAPIAIAPSLGRPLAPAPLNVQRIVTSTNKRSLTTTTTTTKKRQSKALVQFHSESILQHSGSSPPIDPFAESISGLMQNFDQELLASNFLSQPTTTNILSNGNLLRTSLDQIDLRQIVNTSIHQNDLHDRFIESETNGIHPTTTTTANDFTVDHEQISSLINEEEMRLVEMNFDENTFLKQFDLDESSTMKFPPPSSEPNIFNSLLTTRQQQQSSEPPPPAYPGSSLINNNVFTTVVPLALHQHRSNHHPSPEEGVRLTARHIEPSQVATYESGKYQDILDELVTVTDQDVLSHAQASAAPDPTVLSTDFTFALLEATNEIIKTTEIEAAEETASAFVDLQYFYPTEKDEDEEEEDEEEEEEEEVVPPVSIPPTEERPADAPSILAEKFESEVILSPKSEEEEGITDLSSILQFGQSQSSSSPIKSPAQEITAPIDYDALLPPLPPAPAPPPPARIIFEPILSPMNPSSPISDEMMVLDSGCLDHSSREKSAPIDEHQIEDLLNETTLEPVESSSPLVEATENELQRPAAKEQYSPIPSVKLKLHSIYPKEEVKPPPPPPSVPEPVRAPLKIKIRTKLPPPPPPVESPPPVVPKLKIRKPTKKPKRRKTSPTVDEQLEREVKRSLATEYAGLTRFEQPLAQLYHQPSSNNQIPPTPGENDESVLLPTNNYEQHHSPSPTTSEKKSQNSSPLILASNSNRKFSHLFNGTDEQLTKTTFITPPPDMDFNVQQSKPVAEEHYPTNKKIKKHHPNPSSFPKHPQQHLHQQQPPHPSARKMHEESHFFSPPQPPAPPPPSTSSPSPSSGPHLDPYAQSYHQFNTPATPFFHFPFANPYINPQAPPAHYHPNAMKYHHHHHHPVHGYPPHQTPFNYHAHAHPHLQRQQQQQYHNSNYMSSRDHHPFNR